MIWLPELVEPAENFKPFFTNPANKISSVRNVWLLNYRNQGGSDHHHSYDMDEMTNDIIRFMDDNKITLATIGGHGFGAKVATATAINNMDRFTGVMSLEGGPLDHRFHEAYQELSGFINYAADLKLNRMSGAEAVKALEAGITCPKWQSIFKQNLDLASDTPKWKFNVADLAKNTQKNYPDVAVWDESFGLWPGQAWACFATNSRWVHLSTNTLPFYNVFPRM
jgi:pimeloyl-ACP methyl ester carboxylesterase